MGNCIRRQSQKSIKADTRSGRSKTSKPDEGHEGQRKLDETHTGDHLEYNAANASKTADISSGKPKTSKPAKGHKVKKKSPDHPANNVANARKPEDGPCEITKALVRCTDLKLYRITESYQGQLESEIKDVIQHIRESFSNTCQMSQINLQAKFIFSNNRDPIWLKLLTLCVEAEPYFCERELDNPCNDHHDREIGRLTGNNQMLEASQLLLKSVLDGNILECRMFWNILSGMQVNRQNLVTLLKQDVEEEVILQHRHNLRVQTRNMKMPKSRLISDIYVNPMMTVTESHEDITGESSNHEREVEIHELLKRCSSDIDTAICLVYGAEGIGKTTLIQKIIHDWATGKKYQEFRFILHFKVQNLNAIKGRITLSRLIIDTYPDLEYYLNDLWKDPKCLLFIFDDLDQIHPNFMFTDNERSSDLRHRCTHDTDSSCLVRDIVHSLLQGELLKGCSVLITARIWENETLRHVTADSTVKVTGFTSEKAKDYFCRYLRHGHYLNEVVQLIEENDILRSMSSNPLFCYALASSLESQQSQREEQTNIPLINHTQCLFDYVLLLLRECGYDDQATLKCLSEVGDLAYKGITRSILSFEAGALSELDTYNPNFISAFMIQVPNKRNGGLVYEFSHIVLRDFLAALVKIQTTETAQLKGLLDAQFTDTTGRFKKFSLFLVGLSSQNLTDHLKLQMCSVPSDNTSCISEWLTNSVKRRLMSMDGNYAQYMFLHILYCINEFGDNIIMKEVLASIKTIKLNQLTSSDCTVLCRTLQHSEVIEELDLSSSLPQPEEIQKLVPILHRCVTLRLNQNNLQDTGVKHIFKMLGRNDCKIQTLELKSNHLTDDSLSELFSSLCTNLSLTMLNLSNSSQDGQQNNQFTRETLQHHVDNYAQRKAIRWLRYEHTGQDTTSNLLYVITD